MTPLRLFAAGVLCGAALCACGARDASYDPSNPFALRGLLVPPDVVRSAAQKPGRSPDGIFFAAARGRETTLCCWVARRASPLIAKHGRAETLHVNTYIPDQAPFRDRAQTMTVGFAGYPHQTRIGGLKPGFNDNAVPVPPALQPKTGNVRVSLNFAFDFDPFDGKGGGTERYAAMLVSVYFE